MAPEVASALAPPIESPNPTRRVAAVFRGQAELVIGLLLLLGFCYLASSALFLHQSRGLESSAALRRAQGPSPTQAAAPARGAVIWCNAITLILAAPTLVFLVNRTVRPVRQLEDELRRCSAHADSAHRRLSQELREREELLLAISHDLRAPIRNISGLTEMLLHKHRATLDRSVTRRLERIAVNAQIETNLICDLLELSRIRTDRRRPTTFDLHHLVQEVAREPELNLASSGVTLHIDTPLPTLHAERARLRQVFHQLFDNAVKYMGPGMLVSETTPPLKEIHVSCTSTADHLEIQVRDTGLGIEGDDQDVIFLVFRRGRSASIAGVGGKGVGLAQVKSIVETLGGRVWVESQPGGGSTFRFTISARHVGDPIACAGGK